MAVMANPATDDFQVFIKPAGSRCNLRCRYCYYVKNATAGHPRAAHVMNEATLERCTTQLFAASRAGSVMFTWHGGEPMLAGLGFYRRAVALQKKHAPEGKCVLNGMQTNGTLVTGEWLRFFAENRFTVGVSLDGPEELHNAMRHTAGGAGSFAGAAGGFRQLVNEGIATEVLCVVSSVNVKYPLEVYRFLKSEGARYITFLPLVERAGEGGVSERSVPSLEFGHFLAEIFDEWVKGDIGAVKVQIFEEALRTAFGQEHSLCIFRERCGGVPVIEMNGDFYRCDHFVYGARPAGNINTCSLEAMLNHPAQKAFGCAKLDTLPGCCTACEVRSMCNGECPKNRFTSSPGGEPGLNYLCSGYRYFFNRCRPFVSAVSAAWQAGAG
jgi:uncharacterized protein